MYNSGESPDVSDVKTKLIELFLDILNNVGSVIAALVMGIFLGWYLKFFLYDRKVLFQISKRLEEKDKHISDLKRVALERLSKVKVEKADKSFIKRLKSYFGDD